MSNQTLQPEQTRAHYEAMAAEAAAQTQRVDVLALAERAGIAKGLTVNIVFNAPDIVPMLRTLVDIYTDREFGKDWVKWRWKPHGQTPWGTADCGFGGNVIDDEFIAELEALAGGASHG